LRIVDDIFFQELGLRFTSAVDCWRGGDLSVDPELGLGEEVHHREHDRLESESHSEVEFDCVPEFLGIVQEGVDIVTIEEEVNDHRIDSIAASEDPSADDMKVSDWRSHEEEVNNGDDSQKGMLVERNDVGGLALGRQEGPESKCNAAGESWGNCV